MGLFFSRKKRRNVADEEEQQVIRAHQTYPFYIKAPMVIIGIYLFFYIMFLLQDILVPFAFAGLIAILLNPLYNSFSIGKSIRLSLSHLPYSSLYWFWLVSSFSFLHR